MLKLLNTILIILKGSIAFLIFILFSLHMTILALIPIPLKKPKIKRLYTNHFKQYCKLLTNTHFNIKVEKNNPYSEDFTRPAIIVCNHQTLFDVPLTLGFFPNLFVVTNNWHGKSTIRYIIEKYVDFIPNSRGVEVVLKESEKRIKYNSNGLFFPEGSRTNLQSISRYHKGAFLLAAMLKIDIIPIVIHASEGIWQKKWYFYKTGKIKIHIGKRIVPVNPENNEEIKNQTKFVCNLSREIYSKLQQHQQ